ncbi:uncharacterized protein LOC119596716 [Penaeus monodon]|uniref:uncharacterized protein LOC119596716 n=1 Tax=Penaeus monodon TaxID=6687 RepID=UPI0018A79B6A|nr:uncharacterized protein LOC119596716 [Penaeus monodon]
MCHMLKVVRNTLADGGILVDLNGEHIRWQYIVELHKLQACEDLRLGNKLKLTHIEWRQQKMKVNLAAQVFSSSVTDALQYCSHVLKLPQVSGCNATLKERDNYTSFICNTSIRWVRNSIATFNGSCDTTSKILGYKIVYF